MKEDHDSREAGKSIAKAFQFLKETNIQISTFLKTLDNIFGGMEKSLVPTDSTTVTWDNSAAIYKPAQWIPRYFSRIWREPPPNPNKYAWYKGFAVHIQLDFHADKNDNEPWVGCYVLESLKKNGCDSWRTYWLSNTHDYFKLIYPHNFEKRAFSWSDPKDAKSTPVRICGYWLNLTDVRSEKDLRKMIVEPLIDLDGGWDVNKLPAILRT